MVINVFEDGHYCLKLINNIVKKEENDWGFLNMDMVRDITLRKNTGISFEDNIRSIQIPRFNMLILLFFSFLFDIYKYGFIAHYIMFTIILGYIFYKLISTRETNNKIKVNKVLVAFLIFVLFIFVIRSLNLHALHMFLLNYFTIFLVAAYSLIQLKKYEQKYCEQFFQQFCILLNIISFLNIYQLIYKRPFFAEYFTDKINHYQYFAYGTDLFRAISFFGHPIVSGMFFSVLFICNLYILKGNWKYVLEVIALMNIYYSLSRSAWITLAFVIVLYLLKNHRQIFHFSSKITYKKLLNMYTSICVLVFVIIYIIFKFNSIVDAIISRLGSSLSYKTTDISSLQRVGTMNLISNKMLTGDKWHLFFGHGLGSAGLFMEDNQIVIQGFTTTDNMYLTLFYELGLLAITVYVVFLTISFYRFIFSKSWLIELSSLCFIFISIDIFFFEGIGWGTVTTVWSFFLVTILVSFKDHNKAIKNNE